MYHTHAIARSDEQGHESEWESERECFCVFGFVVLRGLFESQ